MLAPNTLLQNRYLIVRSIGHGGMGAVYLARDQRLGHTVALKETFFTDDRLRKAFEREARLLAHLRHPALPKVTDHFDEEGGQFIVMEFISGDDLEMMLAQRGKAFPCEQVLAWGDELLKALDYLHAQDPPILHRDIKPANLKLTTQGEVILLDFGLAKGTAGQTSSVMTSRSVFGFTPNFAPLEQIQGTGTGPRSDLYSLAATLYYLMTGVIPPDALTRITEIANGQPDPLRRPDDIDSEIPQDVSDILVRTMAHNRDHRPASARELRQLFREAMPSIATADATRQPIDLGRNNALVSTVVEADSTQDAPVAVSTASSVRAVASTVKPMEAESTAPPSAPKRNPLRLSWVFASIIGVLLIGVAIAYTSGAISRKPDPEANASKVEPTAAQSPTTAEPASVAAPDDSEITTVTDAAGTKTETRTFRNHSLVSKIVVMTADGNKTSSLFFKSGEERRVPDTMISSALEASGDVLLRAVGYGTETAKAPARGGKRQPAPKTSSVHDQAAASNVVFPTNSTGKVDPVPNQELKTDPKDFSQKTGTPPIKGESQPRAIKPF